MCPVESSTPQITCSPGPPPGYPVGPGGVAGGGGLTETIAAVPGPRVALLETLRSKFTDGFRLPAEAWKVAA